MTIYALKGRFQDVLRPLVGGSPAPASPPIRSPLPPACFRSSVGALVAWRAHETWPFFLIPLALLVRMGLNAADGMLAREFGHKSLLGAYLNEICDVLSDAALYAPFALLAPFGPAWIGAVIVLASLTELAGVLGPMVGASRRYDGPMGKSDRAVVFGVLGVWVGAGGPLPDWLVWLMPAVALLVATVVNRVRAGLREASSVAAGEA
jgi:CDP-diacylglycerol---glycerol-3-phosphate 3-phosphatidyltransferase